MERKEEVKKNTCCVDCVAKAQTNIFYLRERVRKYKNKDLLVITRYPKINQHYEHSCKNMRRMCVRLDM